MATKILKNLTSPSVDVEIKSTGFTVLAGATYNIEVSEFRFWATPEAIAEITPFINSGDIVVNDGISDLSPAYGIEHLKYPDFATSQRFLSEPERSNSMGSKTTQEAIEEARVDVEDNNTLVHTDTDILNFIGFNVAVDAPNRRATITNTAQIAELLHFVRCIDGPPGCPQIVVEAFPLIDHTLCYLSKEDC